ncbi:serine hydrolase domain-containing protein [uncultured Croceitalea sp.]|uniref:serine hydrolase domain-containing protein n=1 Tax=uncultured Croceitalea sp. TaxID=1798908 RepID=UPI0033060303
MKIPAYQVLILVFFTILYCNEGLLAQNLAQKSLNDLDEALTEISATGLIKGYGVAVVSKDSMLFTKGYGFSDVENSIPYSVSSLQNIGSVSKTLIGIALLKAQELGKLKLEDPINKHLDFEVVNPHYPDAPILIWHLATHTGTINDTDLYDKKAYYVINKEDLALKSLKKQSEDFQTIATKVSMKTYLKNFLAADGPWFKKKNYLKSKPGTAYEYSNIGATLAAQVLEEATGIPYDAFTRQYILKPLQMNASGWSFDEIDKSKHSKLYNAKGEELPKYSLVTYPDGGLITNLTDFATYLSELLKGYEKKGTLLTELSYATLYEKRLPQKTKPQKARSYDDEFNSGIFMGYTPVGYLGHSGSDPGVATFMFFDPELSLGHIIMLNTSLNRDSIEKQFVPILKAVKTALYMSE